MQEGSVFKSHAALHASYMHAQWLSTKKVQVASKFQVFTLSMSEADPVVTLNRAGHESLDVPRSQVTISTLSRCFGVSGAGPSAKVIYDSGVSMWSRS